MFFRLLFIDNKSFEIEEEDAGNITTVDLYRGVIVNATLIEAMAPEIVIINKGLIYFIIKLIKSEELKS
jgi:hypothetical protein